MDTKMFFSIIWLEFILKCYKKFDQDLEKFDQDLEKFDQELENFKSVRKFWNKNFQDMVTKIFFPEFGFSKTFFPRHGSLPFWPLR